MPHALPFSLSTLLLAGLLLLATESRVKCERAVIAGDSMAPTLPGRHYAVNCEKCGFPIRCGLQHPPALELVFCPACGFRETPVNDSHLRPRASVCIVPLRWAGPIQRHEVIAFRSPSDGTLTVKRVLALPGEQPGIIRGNVYVNGKPVRKSWQQMQEVAITMRNTLLPPPDWHDPLRDLDTYNQSLSRPLFPVTDVLVSGEFLPDSTKRRVLEVIYRTGHRLRMTIQNSEVHFMWQTGEGPHGGTLQAAYPLPNEARWHTFTLAVCDGQMLLAIDGKLRHRAALPMKTDWGPPRLSYEITEPNMRNFSLARDVYYLDHQLTSRHWELPQPLAADEYFVLGDNSPASTDSRHWRRGIRRSEILGKVIALP